ncbi:hypothetical protein [Sphingobacterium sp. BS-2]|uniref:hypothetical protein n=1 Tax=Sphingobacterium sp. BS-2 TaxID=3377129 RepID=UPI0038FD1DE3
MDKRMDQELVLNQDVTRLRSPNGIGGWTKYNSDGRAESRPGTGLLIWDWFFNIDTAYAHHLQT